MPPTSSSSPVNTPLKSTNAAAAAAGHMSTTSTSTKPRAVKIQGAMQAYKWGMDPGPNVLVKEYYEAQKGEETKEEKYAEVR